LRARFDSVLTAEDFLELSNSESTASCNIRFSLRKITSGALISIKQSKDGVLKQVVPELRRLKNKYELLWDQKSPEGYLKIMAVLQKFIDQAISVNTSYNPRHYEDEKIPMSEMIKHILMHYKYGGKTLYYFNTFDGAGEIEENKPLAQGQLDDEDCDSCKI